jgi:hypothetical protein
MILEKFLHRVVGLYVSRQDASLVVARLDEVGIPASKIRMIEPAKGDGSPRATSDSDVVLQELLRGGAIGAAGSIALAAANISLFVASPVLGALYLIGWGASLGGLVGAMAGTQADKGNIADLIKDALAGGYVVLVAHTDTEEQTTLVQRIIGESMGTPAALLRESVAVPTAPA